MMDNPGQSLFIGGSIHLDSLRPPDQDEEDEEEVQLQQEREAEIQEMLANAFDDLEENESFANASAQFSVVLNNVHQAPHHELPSTPTLNHQQRFTPNYLDDISRETTQTENYGPADHSEAVSVKERNYSHSDSHTPWSDESSENSNRFSPVAAQETMNDVHLFNYQEGLSNTGHEHYSPNHSIEGDIHSPLPLQDPYSADKYKSSVVFNDGFKSVTSADDYRATETSNDQLKLLYEARGRELDKLMEELSKVKSESLRAARVSQHKINLLTSENESKDINLKHYQVLISEKDQVIKNVKEDLDELQRKNGMSEDKAKKLQLELETAESTISSLECQITQLKSADSLARNQQLHDDFVKKLRLGNEEEKGILIRKVQIAQQESESHQQEAKNLREQLKTLRKTHDELLLQKSETVTKLTITVQQLQKQYEDLLQSHGSQKILELQVKNKSLECEKEQLEITIKNLELELKSAKETVKEFESALKFDVLRGTSSPDEDSISHLGIKKLLRYDDTVGNSKCDSEVLSEAQILNQMKGELKRNLLANNVKREEIKRLQAEIGKQQTLLGKCHNDLKSSQVEIKELRDNLIKLKVEQMANQTKESGKKGELCANVKKVQAENIALKKELIMLYNTSGNIKKSASELHHMIDSVKRASNTNSTEGTNGLLNIDRVLQAVTDLSENMCNVEKYQQIVSQMREEIRKLYEDSNMWEKRLHNIEVKLTVASQMTEIANADRSHESEYTHAQNVLKKLYEEIKLQVQIIKENAFVVNENNIALHDQSATLKLELERQNEKCINLMKEKEALQGEMTVLGKRKEEEKLSDLQSCQETYLKFHENARKEAEAKFSAEYENLRDKFKSEVARLMEDLSKVKSLYVEVCEERKSLEKRLREAEKGRQRETSLQRASEFGMLEDNVESEVHSECKVKVQELQKELAKEKTLKENEMTEKESMNKQTQEMSENIKHLESKCSMLEECIQIMNTKLKNPDEGAASDVKKCQDILLETQRNLNEKKEREHQLQFEAEINDLKEQLAAVNRKRAEEIESLHVQKKDIEELQHQIQALMETAEVRNQENELEVQRLTDIIMNLDGEIKEQKEEGENKERVFDKTIQSLRHDNFQLDKKFVESETKHKKFKRDYIRFRKEVEEGTVQYKREIDRLTKEYSQAKINIQKRVNERLDTCMKNFAQKIEKIIEIAKGFRGEENIKQIVLMLDEIVILLKQFYVVWL